jgi:hypothetical protein
MHITQSQEKDYAQDILVALREIQDTPGLQAEAEAKPESTLDRLGLSGVARHAVAFALTAGLVMPTAIQHLAHPDAFWN